MAYHKLLDRIWVQLVAYAEFYLNASTSSSLGGLSSFQLDYGYAPRSPADFIYPTNVSNLSEVVDISDHLERSGRTARAAFNALHAKNKNYYDNTHKNVEFSVGEKVFVDASVLKSGDALNKQLPRSLQAKFSGPYTIIDKLSPVNYRLELPPSSKRDNLFHIGQLKRQKSLPENYTGPVPQNAAQIFKTYVDGSLEMEIMKILDHKKKAKGFLLLVQFIDGSTEWVRASELKRSASELYSAYVDSHPGLSK